MCLANRHCASSPGLGAKRLGYLLIISGKYLKLRSSISFWEFSEHGFSCIRCIFGPVPNGGNLSFATAQNIYTGSSLYQAYHSSKRMTSIHPRRYLKGTWVLNNLMHNEAVNHNDNNSNWRPNLFVSTEKCVLFVRRERRGEEWWWAEALAFIAERRGTERSGRYRRKRWSTRRLTPL